MKPGCYMSTSAMCPFYKCENKQKIVCAGLQPATLIHYTFGDGAKCREHKDRYCCSQYQKCPIYYIIEKKQGS